MKFNNTHNKFIMFYYLKYSINMSLYIDIVYNEFSTHINKLIKELSQESITVEFLNKFKDLLNITLLESNNMKVLYKYPKFISIILIKIFNLSKNKEIQQDIVNYDQITAKNTEIYKICETVMAISYSYIRKSFGPASDRFTIIPICYCTTSHSVIQDNCLRYAISETCNSINYYDPIPLLKYLYVHFSPYVPSSTYVPFSKAISSCSMYKDIDDDLRVCYSSGCVCIINSIRNAIAIEGKPFIDKMFEVFKLKACFTLHNIFSVENILIYGLYVEYLELLAIAEKNAYSLFKITTFICNEYNNFLIRNSPGVTPYTYASHDIAIKLFDTANSIFKSLPQTLATFILTIFIQILSPESIDILVSNNSKVLLIFGAMLITTVENIKLPFSGNQVITYTLSNNKIIKNKAVNVPKTLKILITSIYYYLSTLTPEQLKLNTTRKFFEFTSFYDNAIRIEKEDCPVEMFEKITNNNPIKTSINMIDIACHFFGAKKVYKIAVKTDNLQLIRYLLPSITPRQEHLIDYLKNNTLEPLILSDFLNYKLAITNDIIKLYISKFKDGSIYDFTVDTCDKTKYIISKEAKLEFLEDCNKDYSNFDIMLCYRTLLIMLVDYLSEPLDTAFIHSIEIKRKLCYSQLIDNNVINTLRIPLNEDTYYAFNTSGYLTLPICELFTGSQYELRKQMMICTVKQFEKIIAQKKVVLDNYCIEFSAKYNLKLFRYLRTKYVPTIYSIILTNKKAFSKDTEFMMNNYVRAMQTITYMCEPCKIIAK